jgi:hypothetical protein
VPLFAFLLIFLDPRSEYDPPKQSQTCGYKAQSSSYSPKPIDQHVHWEESQRLN